MDQHDATAIFLRFWPVALIKTTMLPVMNASLPEGHKKIEWGEFLRWLGLWLLFATTESGSCKEFWSKKKLMMYI